MASSFSAVPMLARRFLLSKVSDGFLSFIAWVSVLGVALGVLALTVVTSVVNGFEGELTSVITGMNGDVLLYSRDEPIGNADQVTQRIRKALPEAQGVTASFLFQMMVSGPNGVSGGMIEGFTPSTISAVTKVEQRIIAGRMPVARGEVVLGSALAEKIGASLGMEIRLIAPFSGGASDDPGAPLVEKAVVVGLVRMGMFEYDSKFVFATLDFVQNFLGQPGKVTTFKIKLKPGTDSGKASDRLSESFGYPFRAKNWAQLNQNLLYAIKLEKVVIAIILTIIVIVAAFNVVSTLMMMIHDKTREIAILKAMGLRPGQSFGLFCLIGVGMGLVGTAFGVSAGLGISWILQKTKLINLPADIYYIGFLPVVIRWSEILLIAVVAVAISFLATVYPAWQVTRRSPLEGLRYE